MKLLNCSECGLTLTDAQEACPKCHTKIETITSEEVDEQEAEMTQKETKEAESGKRKKDRPKKNEDAVVETHESVTSANESKKVKAEMIQAVIEAEEIANEEIKDDDIAKMKEEMIAAAVEAEALAVIEEEESSVEEESLCETCMAPVEEDQNFCQLCGAAIGTVPEAVHPVTHKSDEGTNKWMAAIGYMVFFLPLLFRFHRKSKFVNYHAKQATALFIASTILFLVLVLFRNILDGLFISSSMPNFNEIFTTTDTSWRHGTGVLFQYYLVGMIYALHVMPFALMIIGFINAIQGAKEPLPLLGRLTTK